MTKEWTHMVFIRMLLGILIAGGVLAGVLLLRSSALVPTPKSVPASTAGATLSFSGGPTVAVQVADTDATREQGLSGVPSLPPDSGMLFLFDTPGRPAFWMKDMRFSLDLIWLSSDWRVVDITPDLAPSTYPATVGPAADTQYVLEVPAGFAQAHHLTIGQSALFQK